MVKSDASSLRRVLIGTAVGALIGLMLAAAGYAAWWMLFARYQPVSLDREGARIERLLEAAAWIPLEGSAEGASPVYVVGHRGSVATLRYLREQAPRLTAAGREVRVILFAPEGAGPAEQATVAALWLERDADLYRRWTDASEGTWTGAGLPDARGDLARAGVVEAGRRFAEDLSGRVRRAGGPARWPMVFWRGPSGGLNACACDDARSWAKVAGAGSVPVASEETGFEGYWNPETPREPEARPLPYPNLPPPPRAEASPETAPSETAGLEVRAPIQRSAEAAPAAPSQPIIEARPAERPMSERNVPAPAPRARSTPSVSPPPPSAAPAPSRQPPAATPSGRRAPEARRQDDSLFF